MELLMMLFVHNPFVESPHKIDSFLSCNAVFKHKKIRNTILNILKIIICAK